MTFPVLLFLFIVLPVCELWLLFRVADLLGPGGGFLTFGLVILTGMIGAHLARGQGVKVFGAIQRDLAAARMPTDHLISGLLVLVGGVMLITPGIMTDITGLFLMIPGNRRLLIPRIKRYFSRRMQVQVGPLAGFGDEVEAEDVTVRDDAQIGDEA